MNDLLSARDRKNLPSKICTKKLTVNLTVFSTCKCYQYWKERLSEIEKELLVCKAARTNLYKNVPIKSSSTINLYSLQLKKDIIYLRLLKQETLQIYKEAKKLYLESQKKYSQQIEAETPSWKNVQGKFLHKITIINKLNKEVLVTSFIKLDEEYCSFSDFINNYNIMQTIEDENKLHSYDFFAFFTFKTLMQFYRSNDFKISIEPTNETPNNLFDIIQFKAYQQGGSSKARLTYDEFKEKIEHASGKSLIGFKEWFIINFKNTIKKQSSEKKVWSDIINSGDFKKTYKNWKRYFDMWQNGETPETRKAKSLAKKI